MEHTPFSTEWLTRFQDPYAVLGLSVTADDRRVLKRYRDIAKLLHPDLYVQAEESARSLSTQLFAKIVSPAYQKLKQDKGRAENLAMLRFRVRRLTREKQLQPHCAIAQELMGKPPAQIDVFYEQAIARLAETQYKPLNQFDQITPQLDELNLTYLRLKMGEPIIREKRTGLISTKANPVVQPITPVKEKPESDSIDYAERHYARAQSYARNNNWAPAVRELKDAIKIEASRSNYHALLAVAYLKQDLPTMARVHCRQALKLNPEDSLAIKYASKLGINPQDLSQKPADAAKSANANKSAKSAAESAKPSSGTGLFNFFAKRQ